MLRQESCYPLALLVHMIRAFPVTQYFRVGQQFGNLQPDHGRVGRVVAGQDD